MSNVETEWPIVILPYELNGMLRYQLRGISRFLAMTVLIPPIEDSCSIDMAEVIHVSTHITTKPIKTLMSWVVLFLIAKMPFAEQGCSVPGSPEDFRERKLFHL